MKKALLITAVVALSFLPILASAQSLPDVWNPASIKWQLVTCTGVATPATTLPDGTQIPAIPACQTLCDLITTVETDIYLGIAIVMWFIIPIILIVAGIMYMMGGANPGLLTTAKSALKGAVIGAIIILCSYLLISTIVQTLKITGIGGFGSPTCTLSAQTGQPGSGSTSGTTSSGGIQYTLSGPCTATACYDPNNLTQQCVQGGSAVYPMHACVTIPPASPSNGTININGNLPSVPQ